MSALRVQELEEENAFLRRQLGLAAGQDIEFRLASALHLTEYEARMLAALYERRGPKSRDGLMDIMYGGSITEPNIKIIDVYVCKIRRKIGPTAINTIWGMGFELTEEGREICRRAIDGEVRL